MRGKFIYAKLSSSRLTFKSPHYNREGREEGLGTRLPSCSNHANFVLSSYEDNFFFQVVLRKTCFSRLLRRLIFGDLCTLILLLHGSYSLWVTRVSHW